MINKKNKLKKLEKKLLIGKKKFIIIYGVLGWGLSVSVIIPLIKYILFHTKISFLEFIIDIIIYSILGFFWGYFMWSMVETQYYNYSKNNNKHEKYKTE